MSQEPMGQTEAVSVSEPVPAGEPGPARESVQAGDRISSTSDARTINNVMRHEYKILTDDEKSLMRHIKDRGLGLWETFDGLGTSRELSIAKTKLEEAVMWSIKHLTK